MKLVTTFGAGFVTDINKFPILDDQTFLHIFDVFDNLWLDELFQKKGTPKVLLSDHLTSYNRSFSDTVFFGLPLWLSRETKQWNNEEFSNSNLVKTEHCFNFMINKKQLTRFLLIKLVEIFNLSSYNYTWSGIERNFDLGYIIKELNELQNSTPLTLQQKNKLLSPIELEKKFVSYPGYAEKVNNYARINYGGNRWSWDNVLKPIFTNSAVALISETIDSHLHTLVSGQISTKGSVFTEKTLYSMLGLNFPIWVGGYGQADEWSRLGFDIFEDIVDHSYQHYDTVIERCFYAFYNNLHLLQNLDLAANLRNQNVSRLLSNREKILSLHLDKFIDMQINSMPVDYQIHAKTVNKFFQNSQTNMVNYISSL